MVNKFQIWVSYFHCVKIHFEKINFKIHSELSQIRSNITKKAVKKNVKFWNHNENISLLKI